MSAEASKPLPSDRGQHLLRVLIQRYIREGQPVGSRTLAKDAGLDLSPATIRNVMSDLEEMGLVSAPHTSAGRIPTPKGYRLFVDTLVRYRPPDDREMRRIRAQIRGESSNPEGFVAAISVMLSEFTSMAGVVTVPRAPRVTLRQIEFLPLSENRVLVILVVNDREVQNRILQTDRNYTASELIEAQNFINEHYAGLVLEQVRSRLLEDLDTTRDSMNQTMHEIISVAQSAMDGAGGAENRYVVAGETKLMDFAELSDVGTLRGLFEAFSRKRLILDLLDRSINANGVQIFIGEESGYRIFDGCSVVTAPYHMDDDTIGVLGVIGPTRMAYDRVVPIVDVTARLLEAALHQSS
ncbi:MAG: heat-inducible transcriptional repressor HrcA [Gammaproteobacteria bacterium]|nr:heat-inducible transcriptional repressor HrcA [Gammaproteobacteria bacterium]MDH5239494.1 heat-inducible transcriptional repressor HrcA [Gammaproteobacteria bacterium]MDH5262408.1 heat-inducible transcriptional repressor HrcA [Gammaproteobacteria bacterium]MDH5584562.1 heat-inducible transcriptional repressor HrcA [Gammaproteobacteria bacterium]